MCQESWKAQIWFMMFWDSQYRLLSSVQMKMEENLAYDWRDL